MQTWLFIHLIFLGFWGGCVVVEMVMEYVSRRDLATRHHVAQLHYYIDLFVEIPILVMVLLSGLLQLNLNKMSSLYVAKLIAGGVPVFINILCVIPVVKRKFASDAGDVLAMERNTKLIWLAFFSGFGGALVALGIGLRMLGMI